MHRSRSRISAGGNWALKEIEWCCGLEVILFCFKCRRLQVQYLLKNRWNWIRWSGTEEHSIAFDRILFLWLLKLNKSFRAHRIFWRWGHLIYGWWQLNYSKMFRGTEMIDKTAWSSCNTSMWAAHRKSGPVWHPGSWYRERDGSQRDSRAG